MVQAGTGLLGSHQVLLLDESDVPTCYLGARGCSGCVLKCVLSLCAELYNRDKGHALYIDRANRPGHVVEFSSVFLCVP
jgi:hypothetical protein